MKSRLRYTALLLLIATTGYWWAKGAHSGWSQDRVPVTKIDEVTEIAFTTYEEHFVPGLEVLGAGVLLTALLFGSTFFIRSTHHHSSPS